MGFNVNLLVYYQPIQETLFILHGKLARKVSRNQTLKMRVR